MKTVPQTSFVVNREEWKLMLNLLDCATNSLRKNDVIAALREVKEAESIASAWQLDSLAGHVLKRIKAIRTVLEK